MEIDIGTNVRHGRNCTVIQEIGIVYAQTENICGHHHILCLSINNTEFQESLPEIFTQFLE